MRFHFEVPVHLDQWNLAAFREMLGDTTPRTEKEFEDFLERQLHRVMCEYVRRVTDGDLAERYQPDDAQAVEAFVEDTSVPAVFAAWWRNASCALREEFLERIGAKRDCGPAWWRVDALSQ